VRVKRIKRNAKTGTKAAQHYLYIRPEKNVMGQAENQQHAAEASM